MKSSFAHPVNAALLSSFCIASLLYFNDLPRQIPMHFDLGGTPDRYADATLLRWLLLPAATTVVALALYGSAWMIGRRPSSLNVLSRAKYDVLTRPDKEQVVAVVQRRLYWLAVGVIVMFVVLQFGTYRVAHGVADDLPFWPAPLVIVLALLAMSLWETEHRINKLYDQNRA